ncbi:cell division protein FtsL [Lachnospira multipara]|jgi:cell division protein FtsL|uniref:cell division protein FtsL n=1 Tax=Lachnospira multipara TaxID=28051 RepID=UPI000485EEFB|nr:cell division protein FtsL [Lachnospira multipara]
MANYGKRKQYKSAKRATYVSGSAARQLAPKPEREIKRRQELTEKERLERRRRLRIKKRQNKLNLIYLTAMAAIVVTIVAVCYGLVSLETSTKANQTRLDKLQQEYQDLKQDNDELELQINANIDYDKIYDTAVNELGMVYPDSSQVILYESGESEYVKQYKDVPGTE